MAQPILKEREAKMKQRLSKDKRPDKSQLNGRQTVLALREWLESPDGQHALDESILKAPALRQYLENRLRAAFLAGVDTCRRFYE